MPSTGRSSWSISPVLSSRDSYPKDLWAASARCSAKGNHWSRILDSGKPSLAHFYFDGTWTWKCMSNLDVHAAYEQARCWCNPHYNWNKLSGPRKMSSNPLWRQESWTHLIAFMSTDVSLAVEGFGGGACLKTSYPCYVGAALYKLQEIDV